ncbi:unnamed protein product [Allacma fusca]|uniref:Uncharacterized protein n=1 Tax=Allacma fusca TaxID=39272 RepID=A0A8J2L5J1_9HEXA|nr:unnamed protein product [Allacma fusca]
MANASDSISCDNFHSPGVNPGEPGIPGSFTALTLVEKIKDALLPAVENLFTQRIAADDTGDILSENDDDSPVDFSSCSSWCPADQTKIDVNSRLRTSLDRFGRRKLFKDFPFPDLPAISIPKIDDSFAQALKQRKINQRHIKAILERRKLILGAIHPNLAGFASRENTDADSAHLFGDDHRVKIRESIELNKELNQFARSVPSAKRGRFFNNYGGSSTSQQPRFHSFQQRRFSFTPRGGHQHCRPQSSRGHTRRPGIHSLPAVVPNPNPEIRRLKSYLGFWHSFTTDPWICVQGYKLPFKQIPSPNLFPLQFRFPQTRFLSVNNWETPQFKILPTSSVKNWETPQFKILPTSSVKNWEAPQFKILPTSSGNNWETPQYKILPTSSGNNWETPQYKILPTSSGNNWETPQYKILPTSSGNNWETPPCKILLNSSGNNWETPQFKILPTSSVESLE